MGNLVKLKTCNTSFEAQIIRTHLEAEGIPCAVADENMNSIYGGAVGAFSPRVMVREEDVERALAVLAENGGGES